MQIHELNDYTGNLNASAFLAVDNGNDTGRVSADRLLSATRAEIEAVEADLNGRIDNIIAGGAAPSEAEVTDARRGVDGTVYPSLGDAIRGQVGNIEDVIDVYESKNYLPFNYEGKGKYLIQSNTPYAAQGDYTESVEVINGAEANAIGINITANNYAFLNQWTAAFLPDFSIPIGDYIFSADIISDAAITDLDFFVFVGSGVTFSKLNNVIAADTWTHFEIPMSITSASTYVQIRLLSDTSCAMKLANIRLTEGSPRLAAPLERVYSKNEVSEYIDEILQPGANLYTGKYSKDGYYKEWANGAEVANASYAISDKIYVVGGEKYTFNEHHHVFAFDKYGNPVALWRNSDFADTITTPLSAYYLLANINKGWSNPLIVNHGESATDGDNSRYDGSLIRDNTITSAKLAGDVEFLADGSVTYSKLDPALASYLEDGANLKNSSVLRSKLAAEVTSYFTDGGNITDETITKDKLSAPLIQYIDASGGGTITNNADGITIKINGDSQLYADPSAFNIVAVDSNITLADLNTKLSGISGKVALILKKDVLISANAASIASNVALVIGLGGMFTASSLATRWRTIFPEGCRFIAGNYQMFHEYIYPTCAAGFLNGEAVPQWWGAAADGHTNDQIPVDTFMASGFKTVRFPAGVYVAYPSNGISGRTIIMDEGAIIDGVFHIAYGSAAGAVTKYWCKNVNVVGKVVSTLRVGGAQIDGLNIPDGIHILGKSADYVNQSAEGAPKGVHWHFGCKNINIGEIVVDEIYTLSAGYSYALGIDGYTGEESPSNIHIRSVRAGLNTSNTFDVIISGSKNITIDEINVESGSSIMYSMSVELSENIKIGHFRTKAKNNASAKAGMIVNSSSNVFIDWVEIIPDVLSALLMWGLWLNGSSSIFVNNVHTKYMAQGIRLVNASQVYIASHTTEKDVSAIGQSGSVYTITNTFTIE